MECWSIVFLCTLWLQLYRKTKCACRVTAPALQLCATVTNTLLMCWLCYHTPHFCILVKPTHCSQVYPFSHTRRELSLTQNSVRALALEDTWAVQWKVVLKGLWIFPGSQGVLSSFQFCCNCQHPHLGAEVPPALMQDVSNLFQFLNGNIFQVVQPAEFTLQ